MTPFAHNPVVVVGGGIAGLAAGDALARAGHRVVVLEREPVVFAHASGHNAAIFRGACTLPGDVGLAVRSAALLDELCGPREAWLHPSGALYLASRREPLDAIFAATAPLDWPLQWLDAAGFAARAPAGMVFPGHGLWAPQDGVIDAHRVAERLVDRLRRHGGELRLGASVERILSTEGRVRGVQLAGGQTLDAACVVLAAGAWARALGESCGARPPLVPLRRHLAVLEPRERLAPDAPVVWRVDDEVYLRPESGGVLACPCDEQPWPPGSPPADAAALELLGRKLEALSPLLAASQVRRSWACLRTFAPDRLPLAGPDPAVAGLWWLAGLGGHGMTGGLAAAEALASVYAGRPSNLAPALSPGRPGLR